MQYQNALVRVFNVTLSAQTERQDTVANYSVIPRAKNYAPHQTHQMQRIIDLPLGPLPAGVHILIANDVIFAQVGTRLHLDQNHRHFTRVFHAVNRTKRDIN
jgi:hypothetical protein